MARRRLGGNFARLWTAGAVSNLGDGVVLAAMPLLAASLTRLPHHRRARRRRRHPPLARVLARRRRDRGPHRPAPHDERRRRHALRRDGRARRRAPRPATESIALLVIVSFALGMAETVFDNASQAILPSVVTDDALETANGRLEGAQIVANQFVGPPLGAWLFGLAVSAPFFLDAGSFAFAAVLVLTLRGSFRAERTVAGTTMRADIAEGVRWLAPAPRPAHARDRARHHQLRRHGRDDDPRAVRTRRPPPERLPVRAPARRRGGRRGPRHRWSRPGSRPASARARRSSLAIAVSAGSFFVPVVWAQPVAVAASLAVGAFGGLVWNVITVSLRQSLVPDELLGRVNSAYRLVGWGTHAPRRARPAGSSPTRSGSGRRSSSPAVVALAAGRLAQPDGRQPLDRACPPSRRRLTPAGPPPPGHERAHPERRTCRWCPHGSAPRPRAAATRPGTGRAHLDRAPAPPSARRSSARCEVRGDAGEAAEVGDLVRERRHVDHDVGSCPQLVPELVLAPRDDGEVLERGPDRREHSCASTSTSSTPGSSRAIVGASARSRAAATAPSGPKVAPGSILFSTSAPRWKSRFTSSSQNCSPSRSGASSSVVTTTNVVRLSCRSASTARERWTNPSYIDWKLRKNSAMSWRN